MEEDMLSKEQYDFEEWAAGLDILRWDSGSGIYYVALWKLFKYGVMNI